MQKQKKRVADPIRNIIEATNKPNQGIHERISKAVYIIKHPICDFKESCHSMARHSAIYVEPYLCSSIVAENITETESTCYTKHSDTIVTERINSESQCHYVYQFDNQNFHQLSVYFSFCKQQSGVKTYLQISTTNITKLKERGKT